MPALKIWGARLLYVSLAPIVSFSSRFARNVILSRLLAPDEFGIAVAISVVIGLGSLVTDVALDKFVMTNKSPSALPVAHVLSLSRGALLALVLVISAPAVASLFGVANAAGSFALAGSLSVLGGAIHFSIKERQRNYDYGAESIAQVISNLAAIAVLFPAITILHDHRAIIVSFAAETIIYAILSQMLAHTPYRLGWDKPTLRQALAFGLPLTLNGVGLIIIYQLDRVLVGYWLGVTELARYAVILSLSVVPTNLILSVFGNIGFSYLLTGNAHSVRSERYRLLFGFYSMLALLYAFFMALTLDILTPLVFGASFTVSPLAHVLFSVIAYLRLQRGGAPTTLLLASGRTRQLAFLNLSAGFGLLVASACLALWPRMESMLIGVATGEFIALALFFATSEEIMARGSEVLSDLVTELAAPVAILGALAWNPDLTWEARRILLGVGSLVVFAQMAFELHRSKRFRGLFLQ